MTGQCPSNLVFSYDRALMSQVKAAESQYEANKRRQQYFCPRCMKSHGMHNWWPAESTSQLCSECEKEMVTCPYCKQEIDRDVCWCGDLIKTHSYDSGHGPVPLGCVCGFVNKPLDKTPSLTDNTHMCKQVRFVTAVLMTIDDLRKGPPFSAFNVTKTLREQVNAGDIAITDKTPEDVDGKTTFRIDHAEVRQTIRELMDNKLITGLTPRNAGGYIEFVNDSVTPQVVTPPVTKPFTVTGLCPPSHFASVTVPSHLQADGALRDKLQDYLKGRMGQRVTMKEIQSRFKGVDKTCKEWAGLVVDIGLSLNTTGTVSVWTTGM